MPHEAENRTYPADIGACIKTIRSRVSYVMSLHNCKDGNTYRYSDFAARIGIDKYNFRNFMIGETGAAGALSVILAVCRTYNYSADFILGFTDNPYGEGIFKREHELYDHMMKIRDHKNSLAESHKKDIDTAITRLERVVSDAKEVSVKMDKLLSENAILEYLEDKK